jgi:hypothetical protein
MTEDGSMPIVLLRDARCGVGTYTDAVQDGSLYVYAVRGDGEVATPAQCSDGGARKGHCWPSNSRS